MKRYSKLNFIKFTGLYLLVCIVLAGVLGGCSSSSTGSEQSGANQALSGSLKVYYLNMGVENFAQPIQQFINKNKAVQVESTEFTDVSEMDQRVSTELAAGSGPDVILASMFFSPDLLALAENGAFYDLSSLMQQDPAMTEDNYYLPVFNAGKIEGEQYIIPFQFSLPTFISTQKASDALGVDFSGNSAPGTVIEQLLSALQTASEPQVARFQSSYDVVLSLILPQGRDIIDYQQKKILIDKEGFKPLVDLTKEIYNQSSELSAQLSNFSSYAKVPVLFSNEMTSPNLLRAAYSVYSAAGSGDDIVFYSIPTQEDPSAYRALVQTYGVVTASSKNAPAAWGLFRVIMDQEQGYKMYSGMTVNKLNMQRHLSELSSMQGEKQGSFQIEKLPEKYTKQLEKTLDNVKDAVIFQFTSINKEIYRGTLSYANDEVGYEEMMTALLQKLQLYLNE